jgi:hypothetical protein
MLALQPAAPFSFGAVPRGATATHMFTVENQGSDPAVLGKVSIDDVTDFFLGADGCSAQTLAAGASCTLSLSFAPTFAGHSAVTNLRLPYDGGAASFVVSGDGVLPAVLTLSPSPFDYGTRAVGSATDHSFTVHNAGGVPATALMFTLPDGFAVSSTTCGASLDADCTLVIGFAPTAANSYGGALGVAYNDGTPLGALATVLLSGAGGTPARLAISDGPTWDFQTVTVGQSATHSFTLSNSGQAIGTVTAVSVGNPVFTVMSSTCDAVAPNDSCSVVVSFQPGGSGTDNDILTVAYSDGLAALTTTRALTGTGRNPAQLYAFEGDSYDFGSVAPGGTADHIFHVLNSGELAAANLTPADFGSAAFGWKGGSYPGFGGTCGTQLAAGANCTLVVSFTGPSPAGSASGTLGLGYDGGHMLSLALSGASTTHADLRISDFPVAYYTQFGLPPDPATFSFGTVGIGRAVDRAFTVFNAGGGPATITPPAALGGAYLWKGNNVYPGGGGSCGTTLAAGASCLAVVSFAPTTPGDQPASLSLSYFDGSSTRMATRPLDGVGSGYAVLSLSDFDKGSFGPAFNFGLVGVGQSVSQQLYLVNNGNQPATALAASTGTSAFSADASTCGTQLAPGASCRLVVTFKPLAPGAANDVAQVAYHDGSGASPSPAARAVQGTGTTAALLVIQTGDGPPAPLDFGTRGVNSTTTRNLMLLNPGGDTAKNIGFPANGSVFVAGQPFKYVAGTCGSSLAAGANCTFGVQYAPTMAGPSSATLSLAYDDPANPQIVTWGLEGNATASAFLVVQEQSNGGGGDGGPFDYGTRGKPFVQLFQVSNSGGADATSLGGSVGGLFSFAGGFPGSGGNCPASGTLAHGASCTVAVTFSPSGSQISSSTIDISYVDSATSSTRHATRDVTGASTQGPLVTLNRYSCMGCNNSDSGIDNYGVVGQPTSRSYFLDNSGVGDALNLQFSTSGPNFAVSIDSQKTTCMSGTPLASGAECRITVIYTPTGTGSQSDTLVVTFSDGVHTITLDESMTGTATQGPQLQIAACEFCGPGGGIDFGSAAVPVTRTLYLRNVGAATANSLVGANFSDPVFSFPGGFPGQPTGGCGTSLAAGASCAFTVGFKPNLDNVKHQDSVAVSYTGGTSAPFQVSGSDTNQPQLIIGDYPGNNDSKNGTPFDFGVSGVPLTHTFFVANDGVAATGLSLSLGPPDSVFTLPSGDPNACQAGGTLAAGASCTVVVGFAPSLGDTVTHTTNLNVGYSGVPQAAVRSLKGTDTNQPILEIFDCPDGPAQCGASAVSGGGGPPAMPLDFGTTGGTVTRTFHLFNSGGGTATLSVMLSPAGYFSFAGGYPGAGGSCGGSLPAGQGCTVVVSFTRNTGDPGTHAEDASLDVTAPAVSRSLHAVETDAAIVTISDCQFCGGGSGGPPFDFGVWGGDTTHIFYVNNTGLTPATISPGVFNGPDASHFKFSGSGFPGVNGTCSSAPGALGPGNSCALEVLFKPSGASVTLPPTPLSASLDFGGGLSRALTGSATDSAKLYISDWGFFGGATFQGQQFDYGTSGVTQRHQFTVTNTGAVAASVTATISGASFVFDGNGSYPGGGSCGSSIPAGQSCSLIADFKPVALSDQQQVSGAINLAYTGGAHADSPAARNLTARFTSQPKISINNCFNCGGDGPPFDFGHWGVTRAMTFYVTNSGGSAAPLFTVAPIGAHFAYSGTGFPGVNGDCPTAGPGLASGATCKIEVAFTPSGAPQGPISGVISLAYGAPQPATQAVSGTAEPGPYLVLGANPFGFQPPMFSYGAWGASTPANLRSNQFSVSNQGGQSVTVTGSLSGNYSFPGGFPGGLATDGCGSDIGPGNPSSCTITVEFDPQVGDPNPQLGMLTIGISGGPSSVASLPLSGSYSAGASLLVDSNSNPVGTCGEACGPDFWGSYAVGEHPFRSYFITNTGDSVSPALTPLFQYAAPFSSGSSGSDCTTLQLSGLAPGEQCTLTVAFTPPAASSGTIYSGKIGVQAGGANTLRSFQAQEQ